VCGACQAFEFTGARSAVESPPSRTTPCTALESACPTWRCSSHSATC
jgi:hypothetical protein